METQSQEEDPSDLSSNWHTSDSDPAIEMQLFAKKMIKISGNQKLIVSLLRLLSITIEYRPSYLQYL